MADAIITRRGGGGTEITFNNFKAYYDTLIHSTPTVLSIARSGLSATNVGDYALFAGGYTWGDASYSNVVDAYDTSLTRTTPTSLSQSRSGLSATSVGDYALFAGGDVNSSTRSNVVDAYTSSLVRSTPTVLSIARNSLSATSVGDYALFAGGYSGSKNSVVDAYDTSLTRTTPTKLSQARSDLTGASVGDYALFAGDSVNNIVDAYEFHKLINPYPIFITAGSKYKLNSDTEVTATTNTVILLSLPINGYIKYKKGVLENEV